MRLHCPQAEVVYNLYTWLPDSAVISLIGCVSIRRNILRNQPVARKVVKHSRWLLPRNRDNLKDDQSVLLDESLTANTP